MGSIHAAAAKLGLGTASICALLLAAAVFQFLCLDAASTRRFTISASTVAETASSTASSRRRSSTAASCILG